VTPQVVANLVSLSRATEKHKTALLIEGSKDVRFYRRLIDPVLCRAFAAGNRFTAESALAILKAQGQKGVLAVVDADSDHLAGKVPADPDTLITHTRDIEGVLLQSEALRAVLVEFDVDGAFGNDPATAAIQAAVPLGFLRFILEQKRWVVRVSKLDFSTFIDPSNLKCDLKALCAHMALLTLTPGITAADFEVELRKYLTIQTDPLLVARGHDDLHPRLGNLQGRRKKKKVGGPDHLGRC
jgi:hypothetical protein